MTKQSRDPGQTIQLDRADTRVRHDAGLAGALRSFIDQVRSGDLGMLPVIVGLLLVVASVAFVTIPAVLGGVPGEPAVAWHPT